MWADSSAALAAVVKRSGAGKLRHISISLLWVQEQQKLKKLVYEKVPGQDNPADLFTKGVGREKLQQFAWASGQTFLDGRAEKSLLMQGVGSSVVVGTCDSSKGQVAHPTKQDKSKMSELALADVIKTGIHTTEPAPRRNGRGGVVDWALDVTRGGRPGRAVGACCDAYPWCQFDSKHYHAL